MTPEQLIQIVRRVLAEARIKSAMNDPHTHANDPATYEPLDSEIDEGAEDMDDAEREAQLADECYYGEDE